MKQKMRDNQGWIMGLPIFLGILLSLFFLVSAQEDAISQVISNTTVENRTDCGVAFNILKLNNQELGEERDSLLERIDNPKQYKVAFYMVLIAFMILILMYFNLARKLNDNGGSKDGRRKEKGKEKNR